MMVARTIPGIMFPAKTSETIIAIARINILTNVLQGLFPMLFCSDNIIEVFFFYSNSSPQHSYNRRSPSNRSHKYKYTVSSPSPVRSRSSKHERYSRSKSPRTSRHYESPSPRDNRYSRSRSYSLSPIDEMKQKRLDYSKKIGETSLFAELVKDKHKREKALQVRTVVGCLLNQIY